MYAFNGIGVMVDWTGEMRTYKRTDTYIHARYSYWKVGTVGIRTAGYTRACFALRCLLMVFVSSLFSFIVFFSSPSFRLRQRLYTDTRAA